MKSMQDSFSPASDTSGTPSVSSSQMVTFFSTGTSFRKNTMYRRRKGSNQPRMVPPFFLYSSTICEISRSSSASSSKPLNTS